jgi:hypothetical protein
MKTTWGCTEDGKNITIMGNDKIPHCPLRFIRDQRHMFNVLMRQHRFADKGVLPEAGGLGDQSATYVDAMGIIDSALAEIRTTGKDRGAPGAGTKRR